MLHLYVAPSSASSRKAQAWLETHEIPFKKRNLNEDPLTADEIKRLLSLSQNGCEDLISTRSKAYQKLTKRLHVDLDQLPLSRLIALVVKYPDLLRRPLIFNDHALEVGYNESDIRQFLPHAFRQAELREMEAQLDA